MAQASSKEGKIGREGEKQYKEKDGEGVKMFVILKLKRRKSLWNKPS